MPRYDVPRAAPAPLRLVQQFVNTVDLEHGREWLGTPVQLEAWLAESGLGAPREGVSESGVRRALELREALRALLRANNGGGQSPAEAIATVNGVAAAARLAIELDARGRVRFEPYAHGLDRALGSLVGIAFGAMLDRSWDRLKVCRNCSWAFHDDSRNRSARWCSMQLCGNRLKTGRYRSRRRGQRATER